MSEHRSGELTQRVWDTAQASGDHELAAAVGRWALHEPNVALPSVSFERLRVATVVAEARHSVGAITTFADLGRLADYIDVMLPMLALDGAETARPSGLVRSTRSAMDVLAEIARRCREAAVDPTLNWKRRNVLFGWTLDRWLAMGHLDALEAAGENVRFERTRLGGLWNRARRHSWVVELFSARGTGGHAENNCYAAALRRDGCYDMALPLALTSMAQMLNSAAGKTTAAVCRDLGVPEFRNPNNACWLYIGMALEPWYGSPQSDIPAARLIRARQVASQLFSSFGLDLVESEARVAQEHPDLIRPTRVPNGTPATLTQLLGI